MVRRRSSEGWTILLSVRFRARQDCVFQRTSWAWHPCCRTLRPIGQASAKTVSECKFLVWDHGTVRRLAKVSVVICASDTPIVHFLPILPIEESATSLFATSKCLQLVNTMRTRDQSWSLPVFSGDLACCFEFCPRNSRDCSILTLTSTGRMPQIDEAVGTSPPIGSCSSL
jgi:hypothetical protein